MKQDITQSSLRVEEEFHDQWADSVDYRVIDVQQVNEVCTAPEMRYISQRLMPIEGRTLLDVGCGLGEASVYFAKKGAKVTATDLSEGMLRVASALANHNNTTIETHKSSAESFDLGLRIYDYIYVGNLFHHVDIESTLNRLKKHMGSESKLISWDPLAYNPVINIYRFIATKTRTPDEHPITRDDLKLFKEHFNKVEVKFFWLTTLVIFVLMFVVQRRNPNQERFWKKVLDEGDDWKWLYSPLEKIDQVLLKLFPALGYLCWNVVIEAQGVKEDVK